MTVLKLGIFLNIILFITFSLLNKYVSPLILLKSILSSLSKILKTSFSSFSSFSFLFLFILTSSIIGGSSSFSFLILCSSFNACLLVLIKGSIFFLFYLLGFFFVFLFLIIFWILILLWFLLYYYNYIYYYIGIY